MDSLVPAFVAALLAGLNDRPAWRAAIDADARGSLGLVVVATVLAQALVGAAAALGGNLIAASLAPNARALLLGFALLCAGIGGLWPAKPPKPSAGGVAGLVVTIIAGCFSDRAAFVTFALAARGPSSVLAGIGGAAGGIVLAVVAVALGARAWRRVAGPGAALASNAVLILVGTVAGLSALRLI